MQRPLAALLLVAAAIAAPATADDEVTRADLARAQERVSQLQQQLAGTKAALSRGQQNLRKAEREAGNIAAAQRQLKIRERELARTLAKVKSERDSLSAKIGKQQAALQRDARQAWLLGREQQLRLWLNADDPQAVARVTRYFEYLQRDRERRLAEYSDARTALADAETRVAAEQAQLDSARAELNLRERELEKTRDARRQAVAELNAELRDRKDELARRQSDAAALKRLFGQAREAFRAVPPERRTQTPSAPVASRALQSGESAQARQAPATAEPPQAAGTPLKARKGKLRWPVNGRVAARYGSSLAEGKMSLNGIVIAAAEGSDVRAVHAGRVVYAEWLRSYGQLVILDHGDGLLTAYGHNQSLLRAVGDWVEEGEAIATVGTSGGRSSPGLYFELRQGGEPQDPSRWLRH